MRVAQEMAADEVIAKTLVGFRDLDTVGMNAVPTPTPVATRIKSDTVNQSVVIATSRCCSICGSKTLQPEYQNIDEKSQHEDQMEDEDFDDFEDEFYDEDDLGGRDG